MYIERPPKPVKVRPTGTQDKNGCYLWVFMCHCGNEFIQAPCYVNNGNTGSCGCFKRKAAAQRGREMTLGNVGQSSINSILIGYKDRAAKKGLVFSLTTDEFQRIATANCAYCGSSPRPVRRSAALRGFCLINGIDRIDSDKGYCLENCPHAARSVIQ